MKADTYGPDIDVLGQVSLDFNSGPAKEYRGKRLLDVCLSAALLPLVAPVVAVLWLMVRCDGGPGFFSHRRVGVSGAEFACLKLRSMHPDAERMLSRHLVNDADAAREWALRQKLTDDPRVTRLGAFLRRSSLDELPQLWNVLRGDMSLVGPRPITRAELARYGLARGAYLSCRPGVTGLWQVFGRRSASYAERVHFDLHYSRNASLLGDLWLLILTMGVVFKRTGS
ncbi:MAG: sugar transferase [Rhodobacteraceae bacterium]|nr:sugar transferase [Paracoccaceae bacterium]